MKKMMMIAAMMLMSIGAFAQDGKFAVGVDGAYGFASNYNTFGIGGKFQYEFIENFRAEASGHYFFDHNDVDGWDANLNFHYLLPLGSVVKVYPLVGATLLGIGETQFGFNAGAGFDFCLGSHFKLNTEFKYQYTKDNNWCVASVGAAYVF